MIESNYLLPSAASYSCQSEADCWAVPGTLPAWNKATHNIVNKARHRSIQENENRDYAQEDTISF